MSTLTYNNIELDLITVKARRQAVFLGTAYLYTEWTLVVQGIFNPALNSYKWAIGDTAPTPPDNAVPADRRPGPSRPMAPITDTAVRHLLMQPRRQLVLTVGSTTLLRSPQTFANPDPDGPKQDTTDANNGPTPMGCNVLAIHGIKTFMVEFVVKTCVNEAGWFTGHYPKLLMHEWEMSHEIDGDNYFTTRTIVGRAVFRSDLLSRASALDKTNVPTGQGGYIPDQFRWWLFHPVPLNFRREKVQVIGGPEPNVIKYTIVDKEQAVNICPQNNVTKIEAFQTAGFNHDSFGNMVSRMPEFDLVKPSSWWNFLNNELVNTVAANAYLGTRISDWITGRHFTQDLGLVGVPPLVTNELVVKVWGNRNATLKGLANTAYTFLNGRIPLDGFFANTRAGSLLYNLTGKYVELRMKVQYGAIKTLYNSVTDNWNVLDLTSIMPSTDTVPGVTSSNPTVANPGPPGNPKLPSSVGAWGTYLEHVVSQILMGPDSTPGNQSVNPTPPIKPLPAAT